MVDGRLSFVNSGEGLVAALDVLLFGSIYTISFAGTHPVIKTADMVISNTIILKFERASIRFSYHFCYDGQLMDLVPFIKNP
jgi:hypothetical protein